MLKDITIGQYFPGSSPVHRMDPRFKLIMTLLFIAMLFMGQHLYSICFGIVFCILALALSRIPVKLIWKSIKPLIPVLLITAILDLFMVDSGDVYLHWHFLKITAGGVRTAVLMVTRIIVLLAGSSLLTYTTSPIALTDAIERLLSPLKKLHVPVHTFAMMMTISLRFIPTLLEETDKIMTAQKAQGAEVKTKTAVQQRQTEMLPETIPAIAAGLHQEQTEAITETEQAAKRRMETIKTTKSRIRITPEIKTKTKTAKKTGSISGQRLKTAGRSQKQITVIRLNS